MDKNLPVVDPKDTNAIVESLLQERGDSKKARYLGYRASGFTIREALAMVGCKQRTVEHWRREDSAFASQEAQLPELRKKLGFEFANMEFLRNYRLILQRDFEVIGKSMTKDYVLTKEEAAYLLKARGSYSPQQLEIIKNFLSGQPANLGTLGTFNFTQYILSRKGGDNGGTEGEQQEEVPDIREVPGVQGQRLLSSPTGHS